MPIIYQQVIKAVFFIVLFFAGTSDCINTATIKKQTSLRQMSAVVDFDSEVSRYKQTIGKTSQVFGKNVNFSFGIVTMTLVLGAICLFMLMMLIFGAYVVIKD